jgi:hypothetical protein
VERSGVVVVADAATSSKFTFTLLTADYMSLAQDKYKNRGVCLSLAFFQ